MAAGGPATGGSIAASSTLLVSAAGGWSTGGAGANSPGWSVTASGGWAAGGLGTVVGPPLGADSFTYWRRGVSLSSSLGTSSGGFAHAYRRSFRLPSSVRVKGDASSAVGAGGLALGGLAADAAAARPAAAAGSRLGGAASPTAAQAPASYARSDLGGLAAVGLGVTGDAPAAATLGGAASPRLDASRPQPAGGWAAGGRFARELDAAETSSGGLTKRSFAASRLDATATASVAATFDGAAKLGSGFEKQATGGLKFGGGVTASAQPRLEGSGGLSLGGSFLMPVITYRIYANNGLGDPIDYETAIAEVFETTWTSGPLPTDSSFRFAVRSYDATQGLQEENLDAAVALVIDAEGRDATRVPPAPLGLRAIALEGGRARVEWTVAGTTPGRQAAKYNVYISPGFVVDYSTPAASTSASASRGESFAVELAGLVDGRRYAVVVRAMNRYGEETNTRSAFFTADASPPSQVDALVATPSATVA
ncbi:fibronectin type III domain-containing protein [Paludisphaera mucosa]|uniref:Fibronectin type III domain-containing protein n=1 Tax=Paludisphaera mucosa TaxID=3030827 RepID=A0ABT6FDN5_9BACT|nr:fibronectin type III domain-containing protein [Paludisphaera mucosa]MDG3005503.1 fibronectin type III domain-containing protein [Paludisphaera mucosa]